MKENIFEILLRLFEKTIIHLKNGVEQTTPKLEKPNADMLKDPTTSLIIKKPRPDSIRVYSREETLKLTKASFQFLVRLSEWGVVSREIIELVLHQLSLSKESVIGLDDLKWTIRKSLANVIDLEQLAFLDLVLYQKEYGTLPH